jgi:hypothetical protein
VASHPYGKLLDENEAEKMSSWKRLYGYCGNRMSAPACLKRARRVASDLFLPEEAAALVTGLS